MRDGALPGVDDPWLFFLVDEVPDGEVEGQINREPGLVVALPQSDSDAELPELGPPLIISLRLQALPLSQKLRVETSHSLSHLVGMPLLVEVFR